MDKNKMFKQIQVNSFNKKSENKTNSTSKDFDDLKLNISQNQKENTNIKHGNDVNSNKKKGKRKLRKLRRSVSKFEGSTNTNNNLKLFVESGNQIDNSSTEPKIDTGNQNNEVNNVNSKETFASVGLAKMNYNIILNPDIVDKYTDKPIELLPGAVPQLESPGSKQKRIEIVTHQCRLHPSNKKYSQGSVVNPPLISPGKIVGYTPAGQRHEVDLNFERPTKFNSEYARMQFDDATRINVNRMIHDLETGMFLPSSLDADLERRYFSEREIVIKEANEHFEKYANKCNVKTKENKEHLNLLHSEHQLIEFNHFAVVKLHDFPEDVTKKLQSALHLKLTPLMFKKNPVVVETLEMLAAQFLYHDVAKSARAFLDKVKGLFTVPKLRTFKEHFKSEVEDLKQKTKDMTGLDLMMMTEEPTN